MLTMIDKVEVREIVADAIDIANPLPHASPDKRQGIYSLVEDDLYERVAYEDDTDLQVDAVTVMESFHTHAGVIIDLRAARAVVVHLREELQIA